MENVWTTTARRPHSAKADHESSKERIVKAALRLFSQKGYENTPVREIVEAAGVTKPVLYYYFKNKEDLFKIIVTEAMEQYLKTLKEVCSRKIDSLEQRLREINAIYEHTAHTNPELVRFIHALAFSGLYDDLFDFDSLWENSLDEVEKVIGSAQAKKLIRSDIPSRPLALHLIGSSMNSMRNIAFCSKPEGNTVVSFDPVRLVMEGMLPSPNDVRANRSGGNRK